MDELAKKVYKDKRGVWWGRAVMRMPSGGGRKEHLYHLVTWQLVQSFVCCYDTYEYSYDRAPVGPGNSTREQGATYVLPWQVLCARCKTTQTVRVYVTQLSMFMRARYARRVYDLLGREWRPNARATGQSAYQMLEDFPKHRCHNGNI